jgi:hypothetical protein
MASRRFVPINAQVSDQIPWPPCPNSGCHADFSGVSPSQSLSRGDLRDCSPTAASNTRPLGLLVDGNAGVGVFPQREEVLVRGDHRSASQRRIEKSTMLVPATTRVDNLGQVASAS